MRMAMLAAVLGAMLMGCGPSWTGMYSGAARELLVCPSGVTGGRETSTTWAIRQTATALTINATGGNCNPLAAIIDSQAPDTAKVSRKTCPSRPDQFGGTVTQAIFDGQITQANDGDLTVELATTALFVDPGYPDDHCSGLITAQLARQP